MSIKKCAVKHIRTGRVFVDDCHAFAYIAADDGLGWNEPFDNFQEGFTTASGVFLDRFEAFEVAEANGQLDIKHDAGTQLIVENCKIS